MKFVVTFKADASTSSYAVSFTAADMLGGLECLDAARAMFPGTDIQDKDIGWPDGYERNVEITLSDGEIRANEDLTRVFANTWNVEVRVSHASLNRFAGRTVYKIWDEYKPCIKVNKAWLLEAWTEAGCPISFYPVVKTEREEVDMSEYENMPSEREEVDASLGKVSRNGENPRTSPLPCPLELGEIRKGPIE